MRIDRRSHVFISYSHQDAHWLERIKIHLTPLRRIFDIEVWDDSHIRPGMPWQEEIATNLDSARVAILLLSPYFLASEFITTNELPRLLTAAREDGAIILPVVLSPCLLSEIPELNQLQCVNDPNTPLRGLSEVEQDGVLVKLAQEVRAAFSSSRVADPPELSPTSQHSTSASSSPSELLVFKTKNQQTLLRTTSNGLECYLEDIRTNRREHKWTVSSAQAASILRSGEVSIQENYTKNSGLFTIGPRKNWMYSKRLFPQPTSLRDALKKQLQAVTNA